MSTATAPADLAPELPRTDDAPPRTPRLRLLRHEPDPDDDADRFPVTRPAAAVRGLPPPVPDDLCPTPDLRRRVHQVVGLVLEVLGGRRPLAHLVPHLDPRAVRYVRAALAQRPAARRPSRMTSLHVHRPRADAVEVAAVHRTGARAGVLAARFEGRPDEPGRWRCVTLRLL